MQDIRVFAERLEDYLSHDQVRQVCRAYYYAEQAHDGQMRQTGEAYISHPLQVANILADMHMDAQSLMAALLHDVIEDTGITRDSLASQFGESVAELVEGVSKLKHIKFESRAQAQAENFQKMALAMARDIRVILVKLADRLHNMRTIYALGIEKRRRISRETLEMYAPIAHRLGMHNLRVELEELGFRSLYPMRAERIQAAVLSSRGNRKELVEKIREALSDCLQRENLDGRILGREKHLYSIYRKMKEKHRSFGEIMDVYAFRIIVDNVDTCYRVLGAVHNYYKPVPGRFKDYIAIPKANGYQSLHTSLLGMHAVPIEIQIRTEEMEAMANNGIAAHWLYKMDQEDGTHHRAREWVKGLLELQKHAGNSLEFIENVKTDLFPDEIYLFTPKGNILTLPHGATPVDFAYAVHTDVGHACVACRIDRRLAPLSEKLTSGQTVEVITAPGARPNPGWLSFAVSGKARSNIRHFLKHQQRSDSEALGTRLLSKALAALETTMDMVSQDQLEKLLREYRHETLADLYAEIGIGNRLASAVARQLLPAVTGSNPAGRGPELVVSGREDAVITCARCCHPIPGDPIVGHISSGRGMVIHREGCNNIAEFAQDPSKCVHLRWDDQVVGEFTVDLRLECGNERGVLAMVATTITNAEAGIERMSVEDRDARFSTLHVSLRLQDRVHLARVMKGLRKLQAITRITRVRN